MGAALVALPMAWLWGFSVDDAWIIARVAWQIAAGEGHRFNAGGPPVDAVTPLGFAYLLAPASTGGMVAAHHFAKWLGAACGLLTGAWLGSRLVAGGRPGAVVLVALAPCAPLAAWCVAGMETGFVVGLVAVALGLRRGGSLAAGLAAALRPELIPYCLVLAVGLAAAREPSPRRRPRRLVGAALLALLPALLVAGARYLAFGSVTPLSAWAKPAGLSLGAFYAAAALLWTGIPFLVLAPLRLRHLSREAWAVLAATLAHVVALILVGGDWMPLFRLFVPALPGLVLVGGEIARGASSWATTLRLVAALGVSGAVLRDKGPAARQVADQRAALVEGAAPLLSSARVVAALDVGWVGVSAREAEVVDLAGVTDPRIAHLPGSHTQKRLPESLLRARGVDALVLLADGPIPEDVWLAPWSRHVERKIAHHAKDLGFVLRATLELRGTSRYYAVLFLENDP